MSPMSFLRRLDSYFRTGRNDERLDLSVAPDGPNGARATLHHPAKGPGAFVAGIIDAALLRLRVKWAIDVQQHSPTDSTLIVRWE